MPFAAAEGAGAGVAGAVGAAAAALPFAPEEGAATGRAEVAEAEAEDLVTFLALDEGELIIFTEEEE